jgi:SSS family transporter
MRPLDIAVVVVYLLITLGIGAFFGRHQSRKEFFRASGQMGWLTVGLSVMATLFSSNSFVFYPSAAYGGNLRIGLSLIAFSLMTPVIVFVFIPIFSRLNCTTAYEYLEKRFHVSVRCLASGLFILLRIGWMASATFAASVIVTSVSGVPQIAVIVTLGLFAIVYTMIGGLRAVMWTDVMQFFIFGVTILIALVLLVIHSGLGIGEIFTAYFEGRENVLFDFEPSMTLQYGSWIILFGVFLEAVSAFGADQVAVQRYLAARSEKTAQTGAWVNLLGMWIIVPGLLLIGVGLYAYYDKNPTELTPIVERYNAEHPKTAIEIAEITDMGATVRGNGLSDRAMPNFVRDRFPPGVVGLFLAALLAAVMSSIDSGVHSVTTAIVVDFRDRLWPKWKPKDDRRDVHFIRLLILLIGATSVALACFVGDLGNVFDVGKKLTAAFGGPLLAVFVLAFFHRGASPAGVFTGAVLGASITLGLMYARDDWFSVWFWPIGFGLSIVIGFLISLFQPRPADAPEPLTYREVMRQTRQNSDTKKS